MLFQRTNSPIESTTNNLSHLVAEGLQVPPLQRDRVAGGEGGSTPGAADSAHGHQLFYLHALEHQLQALLGEGGCEGGAHLAAFADLVGVEVQEAALVQEAV